MSVTDWQSWECDETVWCTVSVGKMGCLSSKKSWRPSRTTTSVVFVLVSCCFIQMAFAWGFYSRGKGDTGPRGKIRPDLPGVELSDYRFGLGDPYVVFYERDYYRGTVHFQILGKNCTNLPASRQNWASSMDVQNRCVSICDELECTGNCVRIHSHPEDPDNKGAPRLSQYNFNDKVKSIKFCYM